MQTHRSFSPSVLATRLKLLSIVIAALTVIAASNAIGQTPRTTEINAAITKATMFLLAAQKEDNWESALAPVHGPGQVLSTTGGQSGGTTAIATYALLCAGVPNSDPYIVKAIQFLTRTEPRGTYAAAARCMVWGPYPDSLSMLILRAKVREIVRFSGNVGSTNSDIATPVAIDDYRRRRLDQTPYPAR